MMKTRFFRRSQKEEPGGANATASGGMLTSSERSAMLTDSERSAGLGGGAVEIDIDFSVTESGRTVAHLVTGAAAAAAKEDDDDMNFSITSSGRTIERIMQDHQQASNNNSNPSATVGVPAAKATTSTPLVPAVTATISNPLTILPAKSPSRPIPKPQQQQQQHRGSEDSSGSAFLSGILNPSPNNNNNNNSNQLSHTPPTALGTSYENRHFGKRQRSGSVSGRLRSASDLEEKGLIDRQQKGILKDLIICGDEELQHALDQYDEGNPAVLENMIRSGALQNKAVPDLDLLGDLDLDFLTVNDMGGGELATEPEHREGPGMYTLPAAHGAHPNSNHQQQQRAASMPSMPSYSATAAAAKKRQASDVVHTHRGTENFHDDGIGELEFTGEFGGGSGYYGTTTTTNDTTAPPPQHAPGQSQYAINPHSSNNDKSRTLSFGISADDARLRSNSLFSALINDPKSNTSENHQELGRWMDRVPINDHNTGRAHATTAPHHSVSKPIPIPDAKPQATMVTRAQQQQQPTAATTTTTTTSPKKKGRRKSDSAAMNRTLKAKMKQELAEQKRREKQEKREKKEREKQEKREARLAAKEEKKKLKERKKEAAMEEDEKPVHVPGSGRPRSMSDPNFKTTRDEFGLVEIERPDGWVGAYSPESRKVRIEKFLAKRHQRVWTKTVKYDVRKNFADSRLRVKGRFVKKEDEMLMRDLMSMT